MHLLEWNVCRGLTPSTVPIAGINVDPHTIYAKPDGALIWCRTLDSSSRAVLTPFTCELLESNLSPLVHGSVIKFTNAQPQHSAPLSNVLNNIWLCKPCPASGSILVFFQHWQFPLKLIWYHLVVGTETLDSHTQCNDALCLSNTLDGHSWRDIASRVAMKG